MIRKALIPIAGQGRRMAPISRVVPKALLPLPMADGRIRPALHHICAEAVGAGAEHVGIVCSPPHVDGVRQYFDAAGEAGDTDIPARVECMVQDGPRGFGDAVLSGRDFVGDEPVLLLLGDHVRVSARPGRSCAGELTALFAQREPAALVGMQVVDESQLSSFGVAVGEPIGERLYCCREVVEKPDAATARSRLLTPGLAEGTYLAHAGLYAFGPEVFECLAELADSTPDGQELGLTEAQRMLLQRRGGECELYEISGDVLDTGSPDGYVHALRVMLEASGGSQ
jgi:UTP--glucose-1-phosphate uridylyltransferase